MSHSIFVSLYLKNCSMNILTFRIYYENEKSFNVQNNIYNIYY